MLASVGGTALADNSSLSLNQQSAAPQSGNHYIGLSMDLGAPDLIGLGLVGKPVWWLRLALGGSTDLFSGGINGGATVVPMRTIVAPSLTVEGGHVFPADTHGIPRAVGLNYDGKVGYDYFDAHVGMEVGAQKRVCFFLHAGVSYLDVSVSPEKGQNMSFNSAGLKVWGPSAKLGLLVYL